MLTLFLHIDLVAIEIELVDKENREYMLKKLADIKEEYDFIIIDCAPSLGLLTLNALTAADCYNTYSMRIFCIRRSWQIIKYHKKVFKNTQS
jgi:anion-transporting  ArsA/GET3 family ATPase